MKKRLTILLLCIVAFASKAQTVGDLYQQYKAAVEAGDMQTAFKAIKECDSQTAHCPFASAALAVMYGQGYGTAANQFEAMMGFLNCAHYDNIAAKQGQLNNSIGETFSSLGLNISAADLNNAQQQMRRNYELYMMPDLVNETCVKAFAYRMNAIRNMQYYDESKASGDTEEMLVNLDAAVEACLAADSLMGDAYAQYLLGKVYYEGLLGFKDKEKGLELLNLAVDEGYCLSARLYLAKIDLKKGNIEAAKEKLDDVIYSDVRPIKPLLMDKCTELIDPNYDYYDVRQCQQEAKELMRSLGEDVD